ncbi:MULTISPECIES: hypothetical protein [Nostoc]|uniref:Bulb-type lectin domain-containing protein n=1 Tax=Nostoc paludosum FACHB-159 TaxID=2692908 RepID=A0ABR8K8F6_9NOSO|nr:MULTISPECIES: hypothetical protein [Nostoc]MBD2676612.1 hypothetical protein [Nostoc sp. FACHB-857]MBD2735091.1 hypothetical protein [Nostoc paludosum FACHB-159]
MTENIVLNNSNTESAKITKIEVGKPLKKGERLVSPNGNFFVELTDATGLAMRDTQGKTLWVLDVTPTWAVDRLEMQSDKNLVLYTATGKALWAANIHPAGVSGSECCVLDDDGKLVVSNWGGSLWSLDEAKNIVQNPSEGYLKGQEALLPKDASGNPYQPGSRPGERTVIEVGKPLKKGERLVSTNGKFFVELTDATGLAVRDIQGKTLWVLEVTPTWAVDRLEMQSDKNLVLYTATGKALWAANIHSAGVSGSESCVLDNNGRLVVSNWGGSLWSLDEAENILLAPSEDYLKGQEALLLKDASGDPYQPGSRPGEKTVIEVGKPLKKGERLVSTNGKFFVELTDAIGLAMRDVKGEILWSLNIPSPSDVDRLEMQGDKNLVLYTATGKALWAANIHSAGVSGSERCVLDNDGQLVVSNWGGFLWSSQGAENIVPTNNYTNYLKEQAALRLNKNRIKVGESLKKGERLVSANGKFFVELTDATGLAMRDIEGKMLWVLDMDLEKLKTHREKLKIDLEKLKVDEMDFVFKVEENKELINSLNKELINSLEIDCLTMKNDQNFVLYINSALWATNTNSGRISKCTSCIIDNNGNLLIFSLDGILWSSHEAKNIVQNPSENYLQNQNSLLQRNRELFKELQDLKRKIDKWNNPNRFTDNEFLDISRE